MFGIEGMGVGWGKGGVGRLQGKWGNGVAKSIVPVLEHRGVKDVSRGLCQ